VLQSHHFFFFLTYELDQWQAKIAGKQSVLVCSQLVAVMGSQFRQSTLVGRQQ
jgi:hypothetical protein